jgi:hypothetical protein
VIPDTQATNIYYLAKCCSGNPQYLLAGIGDDTEYTLYAYQSNLSSLIAKQEVSSFVDSVAWSPTGANEYLGVTYQDSEGNKAGRMYKLDVTHVPPLIDLGIISF